MKRLWAVAVVLIASAAVYAADKPRIFVIDSNSWEMGGGSASPFGGDTHGGDRPQTAEIIKTFGQRCPDVTINMNKEKADYVVLLQHEGGKSFPLRDNKVAVSNHDGDVIMSNSTRSLGNAVKDACTTIMNDWPRARARAEREAAKAEERQTAKK